MNISLPNFGYYYHMDEDGNEWGPFTPGQLTCLLNRDVLNAGSKIRAEGDATWYTYYCVPHKTIDAPLDPKKAEIKRKKGDEIALALERCVALRQIKAQPGVIPGRPPISIDLDFPEKYGLVYAGHVEHEPAATHLELVFSGTGDKAAHVFLPDVSRLAAEWACKDNELAEVLFQRVAEAHKRMADNKHYDDAVFRDPKIFQVETPTGTATGYWLLFERARPYKKSREQFRESEIVAICAGTLVRIAYSYPKFAESLEGKRMLDFAVETIATLAAITAKQDT